MNKPALQIGLLVFPRITQLDMTGPFEVFARIPGAQVHLIWKHLEPMHSDVGMPMLATTTFDSCPDLDVICVPGGPGQIDLMEDAETIDFVRRQGLQARYVTSVCTGALVLGAAGLLRGYRAATHWASRDNLPLFGATIDESRVCIDRNRVTGGGVTAGIDFGLSLAEMLTDTATASAIQLYLEYAPQPPINCGSPDDAPAEITKAFLERIAPMLRERRAVSERVAGNIGLPLGCAKMPSRDEK